MSRFDPAVGLVGGFCVFAALTLKSKLRANGVIGWVEYLLIALAAVMGIMWLFMCLHPIEEEQSQSAQPTRLTGD